MIRKPRSVRHLKSSFRDADQPQFDTTIRAQNFLDKEKDEAAE